MTPQTADADAPAIDLARPGPREGDWRAVLDGRPPLATDGLFGRRVVVVGPHPDDESLGVGGTVALLAAHGAEVRFVCLTDGEAAPCGGADLAARRRVELDRAVSHLAPSATVVRYGLPDGGLRDCVGDVESRLAADVRAGDVVLATLAGDGHPDHDAAGAAAQRVGAACGAEVWWFAVWAYHWHDPATSILAARGVRSVLTPAAMATKQAAIACHRSQLDGDPAVVPAEHLPRFARPYEVLVRA